MMKTLLFGAVALATLTLGAVGCSQKSDVRLYPPAKVVQALSLFSDLKATAFLIPKGKKAQKGVELKRGDDDNSFSGFVPADPGTYALDIVFTGLYQGDRLFIGRWSSDSFSVAAGDTVTATFSKPLDTIGNSDDNGDSDGDGFGNVDEVLFGTNLDNADSDSDGVADGEDCDPGDPTSSYTILDNGTVEDCDADGYIRQDLPYTSTASSDCDDRDPEVNVGETCPDDAIPPQITIQNPLADESVGCHRRIYAQIEDSSGVNTARAVVEDAAGTTWQVPLVLEPGSDSVYRSVHFSEFDSWLAPGVHQLSVCAEDNTGNSGCRTLSFSFFFQMPTATMTPEDFGQPTAPFDVTIEGSTTAGSIATIQLMQSTRGSDGSVNRNNEIEIGVVNDSSTATFRIDPAALEEGAHVFYPIVIDNYGNRLAPDVEFSYETTGGNGMGTTDVGTCEYYDVDPVVPVSSLVVGGSVAKMRTLLAQAITIAATHDADAVLHEIVGWGLHPDGGIYLDQSDNHTWNFSFFNLAQEREIEIVFEYTGTSPWVDITEDSSFVSMYHAFNDVGALLDSDAVVAAYGNAALCSALTGHEDDYIRYENGEPFSSDDLVHIDARGVTTWQATAFAPITETEACVP